MNKLTGSMAALVIVVGVGCGGSVVAGAGGSGPAGSGAGASGPSGTGVGASGPSGTSVGPGGPTSTGTGVPTDPCPPTQPNGGACAAPEGFRCSYGNSVRPDCRSASVCMGGHWSGGSSACAESSVCTKFSSPPDGQVCTGDDGAFCTYGDTICACSSCLGGPCMAPPVKWQCAPPPSTSGCPGAAPNDGTPCGQAGLSCSYGFLCSGAGALIECKNGLWFWNTMIACGA